MCECVYVIRPNELFDYFFFAIAFYTRPQIRMINKISLLVGYRSTTKRYIITEKIARERDSDNGKSANQHSKAFERFWDEIGREFSAISPHKPIVCEFVFVI